MSGLAPEAEALARRVAEELKNAERPLVVSGAGCGSEAVIQAAANIAWALSRTGRAPHLNYAVPDCNSMGCAFFAGGDLEAAPKAAREGEVQTILIAENDLFHRMDAAAASELLAAAKHVIVLDHLQNATTEKAEVVFPAATFAEASGTLVNNEGRAQRFFQIFVPEGDVRPSWQWLGRIAAAVKEQPADPWPALDGILAAMAAAVPAFREAPGIAPPAGFRMVGQKIPRQSHRQSGRTAVTAHLDVHEPMPPQDLDAPLSFSMEGYPGAPPSSLVPRFWAPAWNSCQAINKFQIEVGGPLHGGDPGRRLVAPAPDARPPYFMAIPAPFAPREDQWLVIPAHHIFGSEELSVLVPGIAELAPKPYLALNAGDARRLGLKEGQMVALSVEAGVYQLPLKTQPALPAGVAAMAAGLPGAPRLALPAWANLSAGPATTLGAEERA